jgi:hypothetical protein
VFAEADQLFKDSLRDCVLMLTRIATDDGVKTSDQLRAIEMVLDRTFGKPKERIEIKADAPWVMALQGAIIAVPDSMIAIETDDEEVEDAEVVGGDDT